MVELDEELKFFALFRPEITRLLFCEEFRYPPFRCRRGLEGTEFFCAGCVGDELDDFLKRLHES